MLTRREEQLQNVKRMIADPDSRPANMRAFADKLLAERGWVTTIGDFKAMTDAVQELRTDAWERDNGNKRRISLSR
jgi:hypothetical protein